MPTSTERYHKKMDHYKRKAIHGTMQNIRRLKYHNRFQNGTGRRGEFERAYENAFRRKSEATRRNSAKLAAFFRVADVATIYRNEFYISEDEMEKAWGKYKRQIAKASSTPARRQKRKQIRYLQGY